MLKRTTARWPVALLSSLLASCGAEVAPLEETAPQDPLEPRPAASQPSVANIGPRAAHGLAPDSQRALDALPRAEVLAPGRQGLPGFVRGSLGHVTLGGSSITSADLRPALTQIAPLYRLLAEDLRVSKVKVDSLGQTHVHLKQTYNGLDVVGGEMRLHIDGAGTVFAVNGSAQGPVDALAMDPKIESSAAAATAVQFLHPGNLIVLASPELRYVIATPTGELHLAWEVPVRGTDAVDNFLSNLVYVDALSGVVVDNHPLLHAGVNRTLYSADGTDAVPGRLLFGESGPTDYSNPPANDNYWWLGQISNFFFDVFGRDSYDGNGAEVRSTVDFVANGSRNNAFWDSGRQQLFFGPGDGTTYLNFASSGDIVCHEFMHAVTDSEADLGFVGEAGAVDESLSDIFAAIYDDWAKGGFDAGTWLLAEDVYTPNGPDNDAARYLDDPARDGYSADHYSNRLFAGDCFPSEANDYCGRHGNAGISNLAFYLSVVGGTRHGVTVTPVGMARARWIFYRAATQYFTGYASFAAFRAATIQAAVDLYGRGVADQIDTAWRAVGVLNAPSNDQIANATTIGALPAALYGTTSYATAELGEGGAPSVWYKWTPARSGMVTIFGTSPGNLPDVQLGLGTSAEQNRVGAPVTGSPLRAAVIAGSSYRVQVSNDFHETNAFDLNLAYASDAIGYLSDLPWKSATNAWGPVERDKSNGESGSGDGRTLTLNGTTYSKGLGVHAGSDVRFDLSKNYARFLASVGIDDEVGNAGSVVFQVFADNVKIYDSGLMTGSTATKTINLDVSGKAELRLLVTDGGNGNGSDHADWANARLAPAGVSDLQPPSSPTNLRVDYVNSTQVGLKWTPSTDNSGDVNYQVLRGSTHIATQWWPDFVDLQALSPGTRYDLTVRAIDRAGNVSAPAFITANTDPVSPPSKGLSARYYAGVRFDGAPRLTRVDGTVNFDWGSGSPGTNVPADLFSARWTGKVTPAFSQTYTFYTRTNDGARLWIDGRLLVNRWTDQGLREWSGTVTLQANRAYDLRFETYEASGSAVAQLYWSSASQPKQIIPQNRLTSN